MVQNASEPGELIAAVHSPVMCVILDLIRCTKNYM